MQRPLVVLQAVRNLDIGGAQQVVVTLANYLANEGHVPIVCTFRDGPLRTDLEELGIPVHVVPERRGSVLAVIRFVREMLRIRRTLTRIVADHEVDVIQTHLLRSLDFLLAGLGRRGGRPVVYWTFHNENFTLRREHMTRHAWLLGPKRFVYRWLYRLGSRRVSGLIAVSDEVRRSMLADIGPVDPKIVVIPNGVDVARYEGIVDVAAVRGEFGFRHDDFVAVMVGTFKRQKGHVHLVDAASVLRDTHPGVRYLLVGDGELRAGIQEQVRRLGLDDIVRFAGSRRDVPALLTASDCFVLPSLWEGLPVALLEAMASGLPCVATDVSGTQQVVVPRVTGRLVPPGDAAALAAGLGAMADDPGRAAAMGAAGKRRVEAEFSAHKQAEDHLERFEADLRRVR